VAAWEEHRERREQIRHDDIKGRILRVPAVPPFVEAVPSPEYEEQEKSEYQERVRWGLTLFLATPLATHAFSPTRPAIIESFLAILDEQALPRTPQWERLRQQAAEAIGYLVFIEATDWPGEVGRHIAHIQAATGVSKEYEIFRWLVSLIGMGERIDVVDPAP
jgi:hypothetical protein